MIIGIDGNEANVLKRVGIGEYVFELLREFNRFSTKDLQFKIYLKNKPLSDFPDESENWQYIVVKPERLWTQIGLPFYLYTHFPRPDIFFTPSHYSPRFSPSATAISIMDLSYIHFPEMFAKKDLYQLKEWTAYSAKNAKVIFTISQSSKRDILNYYHVTKESVVVTYPGIKKELSHDPRREIMNKELRIEDIKKKYNISSNFILFVGTIQPRKNIERLIEAFAKLRTNDKGLMIKDLQLVIVGKKGWLYEPIFAKPKKLGIEERVKFLDFVQEEDLDCLYKNAICYCLPSLYEGFGLPVLEAMQRGCPVITSSVSSLSEAGGDAALYVNPESVDDIAKKLELIIQDSELRKTLIKKGYEQIKKFSWEKTAKETLAVLQEVGERK